MTRLLRLAALAAAACACTGRAGSDPASVRAAGASGDGSTVDTAAIQRAIDRCAASGGGEVRFDAGVYRSGSLHLPSRVTLRLEVGAVLRGIPDRAAYDPPEKLPYPNDADDETALFRHALIAAENAEQIAIVGQGVIDAGFTRRGGPKPIALKRCRDVRIEGITLLHAPNYAISMLGTDRVRIDGVTILDCFSDGIDPDACRDLRIANCHIETPDDAIVLKTSRSLGERRSCENVTVTNCFLASSRHCFKLGTESGGDFRQIALSNCVMQSLPGRPAAAGIAIASVDGAVIDGVVIANVAMRGVRAPLAIRLGNRGRDMAQPKPGAVRGIRVSGIVATGATLACSIAGIPGHPVQGVAISDMRVVMEPGTRLRPAGDPVPERIDAYPDSTMFGTLPAAGLYARHVAGLTLTGVTLDTGAPAPGPAVVCDDVADLRIDGLDALGAPGGPTVRLIDARRALLQGWAGPDDAGPIAEVRGAASRSIDVHGEAPRGGPAVWTGPEAPRRAVRSDRGRIRRLPK